MPNPTMGNVLPNYELTDVAIAYFQDANKAIAGKAIPTYQVNYEAGKYDILTKDYLLRSDFEARSDGAQYNEVEFKFDQGSYSCIEYGAEQVIGDRTAKNSKHNLEVIRTKNLAQQALLKRDRTFLGKFLGTTKWDTDIQAADSPSASQIKKFTDTTSDPMAIIADAKLGVEGETGFEPNKIIMSKDVLIALLNHPKILDRMAITGTRIATVELLKQLFGVDEIFVAGLVENTAKIGATANTAFQSSGQMLLYYSPQDTGAADLWTPTAGMIFVYDENNANDYGVNVYSGRDDRVRSSWVQFSYIIDMVILCKDLGVYFYDLV